MAMIECEGVVIGLNPASKMKLWQVKVKQEGHRLNNKIFDVYSPGFELQKGLLVCFKVVGEGSARKAIGLEIKR